MGNEHQKSNITPTELCAVVKNSSLITVFVEGRDDMSIYDRFYDGQVSIVQTQGRNTLLKTFVEAKKRGLLGKCVFVADSDLYVFEGIPLQYADIIFTTGYSIENDVVADCGIIKNLLHDIGCQIFESGKHVLSRWFAFYAEQHAKGNDAKADVKPLALLKVTDRGGFEERAGALEKVGFKTPSDDMVAKVEENFALKFRGKNFIDYLSAVFSCAHKMDISVEQYNHNQIINIAVNADTLSPHFAKLRDKVKGKLLSINKGIDSN